MKTTLEASSFFFEDGARQCRLMRKDFKYVPAAETDIRKTFARFQQPAKAAATVTPIKRSAK